MASAPQQRLKRSAERQRSKEPVIFEPEVHRIDQGVQRHVAFEQDGRRAWERLNGWHRTSVPEELKRGIADAEALTNVRLVRSLLNLAEMNAVRVARRAGVSWTDVVDHAWRVAAFCVGTLARDRRTCEQREPLMSGNHSGRLELTWTNKGKTLLAHEDGRYEWVDPADYRVAEVRLLHDVAEIGDTGSAARRAADNLLIRGDALHALHTINRTPEFAREYVGKVRLCYIDPPFNTGQAFPGFYDDNLEHSVWLTMLRDRLVQIKPLLAPNGSVWVHLDDAEVHRCRMVLDDVFGTEGFMGSVIWRSADTGNYDASRFSEDHNTILVYAVSTAWRSNRVQRSGAQASHYRNPDDDPRGPWFDGNPLGSPNPRANLKYDLTSPTGHVITHPPHGWRWSRETLEAKMDSGEVRYSEDGRRIIYRTYLWEQGDLPPSSLWDDTDATGSNRKAKNELKRLFGMASKEVFATPKPESFMRRILEIATDDGDVVLDCFGGSGTTAAVAQKMRRRWLTIEWSPETVAKFALPRLRRVVAGEDLGGVTTIEEPVGDDLPKGVSVGEAKSAAKVLDAVAKVGLLENIEGIEPETVKELMKALRAIDKTSSSTIWEGGGGFRVLEVGPSMFTEIDGRVYLAEWASNGALAEAIAAQYGYLFEPDPPFAGRRGQTRLAVVDGLVNDGVVRLLVDALAPDEKVAICGTAVDPEARATLKSLCPGSTMRKVPAALLDVYRQSRREWLRLATALDWADAEAILQQSPADVSVQ